MRRRQFKPTPTLSLLPVFEAIACDRDGSRVRGASFRRGRSGHSKDEYSYHFRLQEADGMSGDSEDGSVWDVLCRVLKDEDLWVLEAHLVAGVNYRMLAAVMGCDASTVCRRFQRILRLLRAHPALAAFEPAPCNKTTYL